MKKYFVLISILISILLVSGISFAQTKNYRGSYQSGGHSGTYSGSTTYSGGGNFNGQFQQRDYSSGSGQHFDTYRYQGHVDRNGNGQYRIYHYGR